MIMGLDGFGMPEEDKPVWFGILALMVVEIGLVHPPVGMNLYVINTLAKDVPMKETAIGGDALPGVGLPAHYPAGVFVPGLSLALVHWLG